MRTRLLLPLLTAVSPLLFANQLEEIAVTQDAPALDTLPAGPQTTVTAETIKSINTPNVEDTLKYQPNLQVRKRFIGDRNALLTFRDMHSFQTPRALVYGDGILLSNFLGASWDTAPRWAVVHPEEIERVDVLYGPYSARYSGNSLGGVTHFHTRMPIGPQAHVRAGAFVQTFDNFGTDDEYGGHSLDVSAGDRRGPWSVFVAASRLDNESHPQRFAVTGAPLDTDSAPPVSGAQPFDGGGFVHGAAAPSEVTEQTLKFKLGYDVTDTLQARLTLAHLNRRDQALKPDTYLTDRNGQPVHDGTVNIQGDDYALRSQRLSIDEAEDLIVGAELDGQLGNGWDLQSSISSYRVLEQTGRRSSGNHRSARNGGPGRVTEEDGTGWQTADVMLGHRHDAGWLGEAVRLGYHISRYQLESTAYNSNHWRIADHASLNHDSQGQTQTQAVFIENDWQLAPDWQLTLGGRQEWWRASEGELAQPVDGSTVRASFPRRREQAFSPKAKLAYQPGRSWRAELALGVAHRFPTVGELYQGSLDNSGNFSAGFDPDLKRERGVAKNLQWQRFFDLATLTVNLWANDVDDALFRQTDARTGVRSFQNIDRVRSRGTEMILQYLDLVPGLDLDVNVAYTRAKIEENDAVPESEGKQFPRVPRWRANLLASYRVNPALRVSGGVRYASDPYDTLDNSDGDAEGFGFTDAYLVVDTKASYRFDNGLTLAAGIDNLTDERYYVFHPYPGRTLFTELQWDY